MSYLEQGAITGGVAYRRKRGVMDKQDIDKLLDASVLATAAGTHVLVNPGQLVWILQRAESAEARAAELQAEVERLTAELELWKPKPIMTDEEAEAIFGKD